jgi:hypothetical protein
MTENLIERVGKHFDDDTANHEMTILHDDGLYRHLRFAPPGGSSYWYDLITAPNVLTFRGGYESLVFSVLQDMFAFFRSNPDRLTRRVSPDYWSEKLTSGRDCIKSYSQEAFEQQVKEATVDAIKGRYAPRGIAKAVREQILDNEDIYHEDGARLALDNFEHGAKTKLECLRCKQTLEINADAIPPAEWRDRHALHPCTKTHIEGFRFSDTWEWDLRDFEHSYLWACHAIVAGIARYDAAKAQAAFPTVTICGSMRFYPRMLEVAAQLTSTGRIVLMPHDASLTGIADKTALEHGRMLDEMHRAKIRMSGSVYVVNTDGYIGESTRSEIAYASKLGIPVEYDHTDAPAALQEA